MNNLPLFDDLPILFDEKTRTIFTLHLKRNLDIPESSLGKQNLYEFVRLSLIGDCNKNEWLFSVY